MRHGWQRLRYGRGQHLVNGNALVARLLRSALDLGVKFQLNAPVGQLIHSLKGIEGATLRTDSGNLTVKANAVILACGGFPHDRQRLAKHVPHATEGYGHFPPLRQVIRVMVSGWENPLVDNLITLSSIQWRGPRCHVSLSIVDYSWFSRIWLNAPNLVLSLFS